MRFETTTGRFEMKTWKLYVRNSKIGAWHCVGSWTDTTSPAWSSRWIDGKNRYRITRRAIVKR